MLSFRNNTGISHIFVNINKPILAIILPRQPQSHSGYCTRLKVNPDLLHGYIKKALIFLDSYWTARLNGLSKLRRFDYL